MTVVQKAMCQNEFVRVLRVKSTKFKKCTAYYVTISSECDFDGYAMQIKNELGVEVNFINLNYDFEKCVDLLCENGGCYYNVRIFRNCCGYRHVGSCRSTGRTRNRQNNNNNTMWLYASFTFSEDKVLTAMNGGG